MEKRIIVFLVLSSAIFLGWSYLYAWLYPQPAPAPQKKAAAVTGSSPAAVGAETPSTPAAAAAQPQPDPAAAGTVPAPATVVESRQIKLKSEHWHATLSNEGGIISEWTMTKFTDGTLVDPPNGVNLITSNLTREIGGALRFFIPSDTALEKELNSARFEVAGDPAPEIVLQKGQRQVIEFKYIRNGIEASKQLIFKGEGYEGSSGFDFDVSARLARNGRPVDAFLAIGPNFGDHSVTEISTYKHPPQLTYADTSGVTRETADGLKENPVSGTPLPVIWAAVDDNYFAMALVPSKPSAAYRLENNGRVSIAVGLNHGQVNHIFAGPKDLSLLAQVSEKFGLAQGGSDLEDIVSYGWLNFISFIVKPIAQFMLRGLRLINSFAHNFGWSIVIFTVFLNMFFFPLRWKSSVAMKRAAAMQPKMKDIQERMKKLEKNDPRMLDLQKEQIALMKEGNPLMGCLPLLLQMPFFMAMFAILTVSIEVRHAPFFGWLQDLSAPDPYWILPIVMCVTMVAQQALTPTTADPVQKRIGYLMPLIFTWFLKSAPAGLVLYWLVSNLVGVVQQFIINRLNPTKPPAAADQPPTSKSEPKSGKGKKTKEAMAS